MKFILSLERDVCLSASWYQPSNLYDCVSDVIANDGVQVHVMG